MAEFATADWQLGDPRLRILGRPFKTVLEMRDKLVRVHNSIVKPNDTVYVAGDSISRYTPECLEDLNLFNGIKILARGNHERRYSDAELRRYFVEIYPDGEGIELEIDGLKCWLTHYPTCGRKDRFNLVGHVHSAWKYQLNMMNVGVDVHHLAPVNLKDIPWHFNTICNRLDRDIWAAYEDVNAAFKDERGLKTKDFPRI
jgi:calcineurin-like phosphoesterase family protein